MHGTQEVQLPLETTKRQQCAVIEVHRLLVESLRYHRCHQQRAEATRRMLPTSIATRSKYATTRSIIVGDAPFWVRQGLFLIKGINFSVVLAFLVSIPDDDQCLPRIFHQWKIPTLNIRPIIKPHSVCARSVKRSNISTLRSINVYQGLHRLPPLHLQYSYVVPVGGFHNTQRQQRQFA